ncbi:endonuclease domain-containing protein [Aureispira anguillae]|uniref:DUF559 domain-containing protein n=1 Tax=Aureispira anguillae TaxID=2864201 RepID=A0A916DVM1_9BACT|nr:DUF559 domain-containing protein [Aureispira anguillae]BDS13872.1 DUF559 domain-containing protein [Aureispira anguillae]
MDRFKQLKDNNYYYNPKLKHRGAKLRQRFTAAETYLWKEVLMARQLQGFRFLRQVPTLYYVPDFMCKELALIIEVDGKIHKYQKEQDAKRQQRLESCGFRVLRFRNEEVLNGIEEVRKTLEGWIEKNT